MADFKALAAENQGYVVEMRRYFHKHPELSRKEVETSRKVCSELEKMGVPYKAYPDYTVTAVIDSGKPGKTVLIRGDMDALPVQENTGLEFSSCVSGVGHMCGHDCHTAMLLGIAKSLMSAKDGFTGKVILGFQVAEENLYGANLLKKYVTEMGGADYSIALHVGAAMDVGTISLIAGPMASGVLTYKVTFKGKGGHGSVPHMSKDPIKPACEYVLRLASLPSNSYDAQDPIVFSTCSINGGTAVNVIPETAVVTGTVRFFNKNLPGKIEHDIENLAKSIADSYEIEANVEYLFQTVLPVVNDKDCIEVGRKVADEMGLNVVTEGKSMGSDDMANLLDAFPGFYAFIGGANEKKGIGHVSNHAPNFTVDEDCLQIGTEFLMKTAAALLAK
ncbi:MAG: M20 metallopeptidase family protein [Oscillospiraceae bacterium]|jgi:IAA-amino acid hydrolase